MRGHLRTALAVAYAVCMVVCNVVTVRQVQTPLGAVTGGVFVFPLAYVLSDVFSECYGYEWSRATCHMALGACLASAVAFSVVSAMPAPEWYDGAGEFASVLGQTPRVFLASMAAFAIGDHANDRAYRSIAKTGGGIARRALGSSLLGEVVDGLVFYPVALAGTMPMAGLAQVYAVEVLTKLAIEAAVLPLTARVAQWVKTAEHASRATESDSEGR